MEGGKIEGCTHSPWGVNDCDHSEDVGIECLTGNETPKTSEWQLQLWQSLVGQRKHCALLLACCPAGGKPPATLLDRGLH